MSFHKPTKILIDTSSMKIDDVRQKIEDYKALLGEEPELVYVTKVQYGYLLTELTSRPSYTINNKGRPFSLVHGLHIDNTPVNPLNFRNT